MQPPVVIVTITQTDPPPTKLSSEPMATSLPISSSRQPRRYRLVDQHGQPHLELDEHFYSIEEAWSFAIRWWQQQPAGAPCATRKAEPCKGEPTGHFRPAAPVSHRSCPGQPATHRGACGID